MKKFIVTVPIVGTVSVEIDAKSFDDAKEQSKYFASELLEFHRIECFSSGLKVTHKRSMPVKGYAKISSLEVFDPIDEDDAISVPFSEIQVTQIK